MPGLTGGISLAPLKVELKADITGFKSDMEKARVTGVTEAEKISKSLENTVKTGERLSSVGSKLTKFVSLPVAGIGAAAIKTGIDFESAFTGVEKTVDGTTEQMEELKQGIKDMSKEMPESASQIAGVAEAAGQLGIKTENILDFSKTMVMLGDSTNMSSEEAATALARLANITQMPQTEFKRLGSTVVDLGNNFATTEKEIVDMSLRLAGAGHQVGMSEAQILGLSTALSSVGIEAEAGGSAFSTLISNMAVSVETGNESLESFAAVAGMTAEEFQTAFRDNAAGALISFIEGLQRTEENGGSAIAVLDEMGISEIRMRDALLRAAGAGDTFTRAIQTGSEAWEENTALTNEAEKRYETTASKIEIFKNKLADVGITVADSLLPILTDLLGKVEDGVEWFASLSEEQQDLIVKLAMTAAVAGPVLKIFGDGVQTFTKFKPILSGLSKGFEVLSGAGKAVTSTVPKATSVAADLAKEVGGLPALLKPAAKEATELATAGGSITKALPGAGKVIEGVKYEVLALPDAAGKATTALGGGTGLSGVLSNVFGPSLGTAALGIGAFAAAAAGIGVGVAEAYKQMNADVVPEVDLFSETLDTATKRITDSSGMGASIAAENTVKISDATKEALGAYMELDDGVTQSLYNIGLNSENITAETTNTIFTNFASMSQMLIDKENETYNTRIEALSTFLTSSSTMEAASGQAILDQINQRHSDRIASTEAMQARLTELQTIAAANNGQLSREEQAELKSIQDQMREDAIGALTQTEQEAAVIRARIKEYQGRLSAEMASELIIKANEARDGEIKAAQEKRDGIIVQAEGLRRAGDITQEQYDEMVRAAQEGCDQQISEAERTCDGVKREIEEGTPGIEEAVDIQTGKMLTHWESFKKSVTGIFDSIAAWWNGLSFNSKSPEVNIRNSSGATGFGYSPAYNGVENVPYDGYRIYAHKDERLLTAEENAAYTRMLSGNSGGIHQEFNFYGDNNSPSEIGRAAEKAMRDIPRMP